MPKEIGNESQLSAKKYGQEKGQGSCPLRQRIYCPLHNIRCRAGKRNIARKA
nr:MAG TPA: hypothetical protein [Caudoviricetes sp.]